MYEFWYNYAKPKYDENAKLCYVDTDSFIAHVKTDDIYKDTAEDVETRLALQVLNQTDHCLKEKKKKEKSIWTNER